MCGIVTYERSQYAVTVLPYVPPKRRKGAMKLRKLPRDASAAIAAGLGIRT